MRLVRALFVGLSFLGWGVFIALAWGVEWGTEAAGKIALGSSLLAIVYGCDSYRRKGRNRKRGTTNGTH
ncbi:hypothetical protein [Citrobacter sp. NCU1]|uniref:hypothetical protein n=1 Tax=Citrobacter sp. NCU1 TaxID=2026683 RepID=UPI0013907BB3|nr:hypothetical protein [Citrobacter sp. NCU1]